MTGRLVTGLARFYFEISYGLLVGSSTGRRFLGLASFAGGPAVHGYLTADDLDALMATLRPASRDRLLDLGCGIGGAALEIHRRSGAGIVGVDASTRAVAEATARARRVGADDAVRFVVGDLAHPPAVDAAGACAIDSLMFLPDLAGVLRGICETLGAGRRVFATVLVAGPGGAERLAVAIAAAGLELEVLDDVTGALATTSCRRALTARALLRRPGDAPGDTIRGRAAMLLILLEETLVGRLVARGRLGRWRFVVRCAGRAPGMRGTGRDTPLAEPQEVAIERTAARTASSGG